MLHLPALPGAKFNNSTRTMNRSLNLIRARAFLLSVFALLACSVFSASSRAATVAVTYNGTVYNVGLELLNQYNDDAARLDSQIWFGNSNLAAYFASEVGAALGTANFGFEGPYFAFAHSSGTWTGNFFATSDPHAAVYNVGGYQDIYQYAPIADTGWAGRWAYVESTAAVATPDAGATTGLMVMGLFMLGIARRRFQRRSA